MYFEVVPSGITLLSTETGIGVVARGCFVGWAWWGSCPDTIQSARLETVEHANHAEIKVIVVLYHKCTEYRIISEQPRP